MNYAIILSGGIGSRMRKDGFPKQYIEVNNKPILSYTLEKFQKNKEINRIIIVAAKEWQEKIKNWIKIYNIDKFQAFALPGETRQESILNGLICCSNNDINDNDNVVIHDAVRPLLSDDLINRCINELKLHDGCMPVLSVKDTIYKSVDGMHINKLENRDLLFAGQAPEAFNLRKYYQINNSVDKSVLANTRGSSEIAFKNGLDVVLINGEDTNFKLTTPVDLKQFESIINEVNNESI